MRLALLIGLGLTFVAAPALGQEEPPNPFGDPQPSDDPAPPSDDGPGTVFTDQGGTSPPPEPVCAAPCPAGTTCVQGHCVARCSPPCPVGQFCGAGGACIGTPTTPTTGAPGYGAPATPGASREPISGSPAVIRGGVGMGMAALSVGLGLGAWATERNDPSAISPVALTGVNAAVLLSGILVARSGSSKVRGQGGATGIPFFRVTTWIFFGMGMLIDVVSIGVSATSDTAFENAHLAGGIAGALALMSAGADSLVAGLQQNQLRRVYEESREQQQALRWIPRLGRMRDLTGAMVPALGWSGAF